MTSSLDKAKSLFASLPPRVSQLREHMGIHDVHMAGARPRAGLRIAAQLVEDPLYFALFAELTERLSRKAAERGKTLDLELIVIRGISGAVGTGPINALKRSAVIAGLVTRPWLRAYGQRAARVAYRSRAVTHPLRQTADAVRAALLYQELKGRDDIRDVEIDGILVGDLINDTYLRFRPSPRLDSNDPFLLSLLIQAHRDVRLARAYFFGKNRPHLYLTSYTTYIEHGVPTRAALAAGVPVWSFGNLVQFGKRLSREDAVHTPDCMHYRRTFASLDKQEERLSEAERQLSVRLSGGIDAATSYMRTSAYAKSAVERPDVRGAVIVFLHDFYDSPHVYHDLVFPDFWAWITCTIRTLEEAGIPFFVKPHPNQIELSSAVLAELREAHPKIRFLPSACTNTQLAEGGMRCGVTVYGTVAHELAFLGVPSIGCARHPHIAFEFCRTAKTVDEYEQLLRRADEIALPKEVMRKEALQFYYMHNLFGDEETLDARRKYVAFWALRNREDASEDDLVASFNELRSSSGFTRLVDVLWNGLDAHTTEPTPSISKLTAQRARQGRRA